MGQEGVRPCVRTKNKPPPARWGAVPNKQPQGGARPPFAPKSRRRTAGWVAFRYNERMGATSGRGSGGPGVSFPRRTLR